MYENTTTPDGYTVNSDGAWTVDGVVQTQAAGAPQGSSDSTAQTSVSATQAAYRAHGFTDAVYDILHSDRASNAAKYGVIREEPATKGISTDVVYANGITATYFDDATGKPFYLSNSDNTPTGVDSPIFTPFAVASNVALASFKNPPDNLDQFPEAFWFAVALYDQGIQGCGLDNAEANRASMTCEDSDFTITYYPENDSWSLHIMNTNNFFFQ